MLKVKLIVFMVVGIVLAFGSSAVAQRSEGGLREQNLPIPQERTQQRHRDTSTLNSREERFLNQSAQASLLELAAAKLAVQKSQSPQVVEYASRLIKDYDQYSSELMRIGREKELNLPVDLNRDDQSELERLTQLQGTEFDREYLQKAVETNNSNVNDFRQAARIAEDPDVQAFIAEFLPVQQQHLQLSTGLTGSSAP